MVTGNGQVNVLVVSLLPLVLTIVLIVVLLGLQLRLRLLSLISLITGARTPRQTESSSPQG